MDSIILGIQREIEQKKHDLEALEQALVLLRATTTDREQDDGELLIPPAHFQGLKGKNAVVSFFHLKKSDTATLEEIESALKRGGARVGRYPKRMVKNTIVWNKKFFSLSGNIVQLIR